MKRLRLRTLLSSSALLSRGPTIVSVVVGVLILLAAVAVFFGSQISVITDVRSGGDWMLRPTPFVDPRHPVRNRLLDLWDYKSCPPPSCPHGD